MSLKRTPHNLSRASWSCHTLSLSSLTKQLLLDRHRHNAQIAKHRKGLKHKVGHSLFQALCQWRIEKAGGRQVGSGREKGELFQALCQWGIEKAGGERVGSPGSRSPLTLLVARRPLAFSIVLTDREPGTG